MHMNAPLASLPVRIAHGTGNDFVVLHDRSDALLDVLSERLVRALCNRRTGVGGDGVIRLGSPASAPTVDGDDQSSADVFMDYRNADGSIVEMCGNGVRVVADQWVRHVVPDATTVKIATRSGIRTVTVDRSENARSYTVDMGPAEFTPEKVPFRSRMPLAIMESIQVGSGAFEVTAVSMGNPHAVIRVPTVDAAPVREAGPMIEHHEAFPERANVGFVAVRAPDQIDLRVWERGVGETQACGTGACAAVAALRRRGDVDEIVQVRLPGGTLTIEARDGANVMMTGPAVEVAGAELTADWLAEACGDLT